MIRLRTFGFLSTHQERSMPIRLAQAPLIPQDSRDHRPVHRRGHSNTLETPDTFQMGDAGRLIRKKMLRLQRIPSVIRHGQNYAPKATTCVNRIGMEYSSFFGMNCDQLALNFKSHGRGILNVSVSTERSIQKWKRISHIFVQMRKTLHAHGARHALVIKDFFCVGFQQHDHTRHWFSLVELLTH